MNGDDETEDGMYLSEVDSALLGRCLADNLREAADALDSCTDIGRVADILEHLAYAAYNNAAAARHCAAVVRAAQSRLN